MNSFERDKLAGQEAESFIEKYGKILLFPPDVERKLLFHHRFVPAEGYITNCPSANERGLSQYHGHYRHTRDDIKIQGGDLSGLDFNAESVSAENIWFEVKRSKSIKEIMFSRSSSSSLPFEIRSRGKAENGTPGWLLRYANPRKSAENQTDATETYHTITPMVLVFCLYETENADTKPFAVVSFYDFPKLLEALISISKERYGWDIVNWDTCPKSDENKRNQQRETGGAAGSLWNVHLEWLRKDSVPMFITTLGSKPKLPNDSYLKYNQPRLDHLYEMANKHCEFDELDALYEILHHPEYPANSAFDSLLNAMSSPLSETDIQRLLPTLQGPEGYKSLIKDFLLRRGSGKP